MEHGTAIRRAGDWNLDHVELMMDGAGGRTRLDREGIRTACEAAGVDLLVHLPFGGIDLPSPLPAVRRGSVEELTAAIETAADCGATKGILHADTDAWEAAWDDAALRPFLIEALGEVTAVADRTDVTLCLENTPQGLGSTSDIPAIIDSVRAESGATALQMTLDTGHARMDGLESTDQAAFIREHASRIGHVHCNDTRVPADEHLPFGAGTLDFDAILGAFPDAWDGSVSLEVVTDDLEYVGTSVHRLRTLLDGL